MTSTTARAAAAIRRELKAAFPATTFSVRSKQFAGGDSVDIRWTDGPTRATVDAIGRKYEYGTFDGQTDGYNYDNRRDDIPQAKYVQCERRLSMDAVAAAVDYVNAQNGWSLALVPMAHGGYRIDGDAPMDNGRGWRAQEPYVVLQRQALSCAAGHAAEVGDAFCAECGEALIAAEDRARVGICY